MDFTVLDTAEVNQIKGALDLILQTIEKQNAQIAHLNDDRWLTAKEAAEYCGYAVGWIMTHKEDIGYSQVGTKDIRIRRSNLDNFFNDKNHFIKRK